MFVSRRLYTKLCRIKDNASAPRRDFIVIFLSKHMKLKTQALAGNPFQNTFTCILFLFPYVDMLKAHVFDAR